MAQRQIVENRNIKVSKIILENLNNDDISIKDNIKIAQEAVKWNKPYVGGNLVVYKVSDGNTARFAVAFGEEWIFALKERSVKEIEVKVFDSKEEAEAYVKTNFEGLMKHWEVCSLGNGIAVRKSKGELAHVTSKSREYYNRLLQLYKRYLEEIDRKYPLQYDKEKLFHRPYLIEEIKERLKQFNSAKEFKSIIDNEFLQKLENQCFAELKNHDRIDQQDVFEFFERQSEDFNNRAQKELDHYITEALEFIEYGKKIIQRENEYNRSRQETSDHWGLKWEEFENIAKELYPHIEKERAFVKEIYSSKSEFVRSFASAFKGNDKMRWPVKESFPTFIYGLCYELQVRKLYIKKMNPKSRRNDFMNWIRANILNHLGNDFEKNSESDARNKLLKESRKDIIDKVLKTVLV